MGTLLEKAEKSRNKLTKSEKFKSIESSVEVGKKSVVRVSTQRKSKKEALSSIIKNFRKYYKELPIETFWGINLNIKAIGENRKAKK